ncbi:MAG: fibronectin type III domain-containing protein [Patescibacteria group bacterium]|nr:fibronectin type III domain-containing protein [Patescibacteria group bacterium]
MRGFTLVEVMVVLGITAILGTVGFIVIPAYRAQNTLTLTTEELVSYLRSAQEKSVAGEQGTTWGVHMVADQSGTDSYQIFYGSSFANGTLSTTVPLPTQVEFSDPIQGSTKDVLFTRVTGYPDTVKTIDLVSTYGGAGRRITITANGLISYDTISASSPGAPVLSGTAGTGSVTLNWVAAPNNGAIITSYKVYRGTSSGSESLLTTLGDVLSYTDSALTAGNAYYYKVSAVNSAGEGILSNEVNVGPPSAPTSPAVSTTGSGKLTVSWQAPSATGGAAVINYKIYRGASSGSEVFVATVGNVLSYDDAGLSNGTTYYYKVSAVNSVGEGPQSSEVSAAAQQGPGAPTLDRLAVMRSSVPIYWSAPASDGGSTITAYKIYRGTSSGNEALLATAGASSPHQYLDASDLVNGTTYYYKVSAVNAIGEGSLSNELNVTPIDASMAFVTSTSYTGNLGGLSGADTTCQNIANAEDLGGTWKAWLGSSGTSASSRITHSTTGYAMLNGTRIANSWTDLTDGSLASAINVTEVGGAHNAAVWTNTTTSGGQISGSNNSVCYDWTSTSSVGYHGDSSSTSANWTASGNGSYYYYDYCSSSMALYCFEQVTTPGAPTSLAATAGSQQVSLSWAAPNDNGGSGITNYKIYRGTSSGTESLLTTIGNLTSYTDTGLTNGTTYYYKVSAVNLVGEGSLSGEVSASLAVSVPNAPSALAGVSGDQQIALSWQAPANTGGAPITNYKIYRGTSSGSETLLTTTGNSTTYTDTGLNNATTYYYKVSAVNSVGEGALSNEASAKTFDFTVSLGSSSGSAVFAANGSLSDTVTITNTASTQIPPQVSLSISGLPSGVTASFSPTGCAPSPSSCSSVLSITSSSSAAAGSYALVVTGTSNGGLSKTANYTLMVYLGPSTSYRRMFVTSAGYVGTFGSVSAGDTICQNTAAASTLGNLGGTWRAWLSDDSNPASSHVEHSAVPYKRLDNATIANDWTGLTSGSLLNSIDLTENFSTSNANVWTGTTPDGSIAQYVIPGAGTFSGTCGSWTSASEVGFLGNSNSTSSSWTWTSDVHTPCGFTGGTPQLYCIEQGMTTPGAPLNVTISVPSSSQAALSWQAPSYIGGAAVTGYKIYRGTSSGTETLLTTLGNVTSYTDSGLTSNVEYYYEVSAVNSYGEGTLSAETLKPLPGTVTASASPGYGGYKVSWTTASTNGGPAISEYLIYRGATSGGESGTPLATVSSSASFYDDTSATANVTYYYEVRAYNGYDYGSLSNEVSENLMYRVPGQASGNIGESCDTWLARIGELGHATYNRCVGPSSNGCDGNGTNGPANGSYCLYKDIESGGTYWLAYDSNSNPNGQYSLNNWFPVNSGTWWDYGLAGNTQSTQYTWTVY